MKVIDPAPITDAVLISSSVTENDAPTWAAGSSYEKSARVRSPISHRIYESASAGNLGNDPLRSELWIEIGSTNRWAMFDHAVGSATAAVGAIVVDLAPTIPVEALAVLDTDAGRVRVEVSRGGVVLFDSAQDALVDGVERSSITFLNLPTEAGALVRVTITAALPAGLVSVGTLLLGNVVELGVTEAGPSIGINDFSRRETDAFGVTTIVERAWAKRMTVRSLIETTQVDEVQRQVAELRARPSLWIGAEGYDSLTIYGFFRDFAVDLQTETISYCSLTVEGLTTSSALGRFGAESWEDIADPNGTKPDNNATNGADPDAPFGPDGTVGEALERVSGLDQLVADVQAALDDADNGAIAARNAAEAAANLAGIARDQSQAARDAANAAKQAAIDQANAAAQSASDANGFATTAAGRVTIATQKADEAGQFASIATAQVIIATTKASEASVAAESAATASNSASGSAASAAASAALAAQAGGSGGDAAAFAAAASQSAQSAAASSTAAGQRASAASSSADSAATRSGEASASANRAAVSETNALGSSQAAASSATLAATARGEAQTAATASLSSVAAANERAAEAASYASLAAAYSGSSGNLVQNTQFNDTANWSFIAGAANQAGGIDVAGSFWAPPGEHALSIIQTDANSAGSNYVQDAVAIVPGQTYEASAWLGQLRCSVSLILQFLDSGGGVVAQYGAGGPGGSLANGALSSYTRVFTRQAAPGSATRARILIIKTGTQSGPDSYMWMVRPQIRQVQPAVPAPAAYIPNIGGVDITGVQASIVAEASARANADTALSTQVNTLTSAVGGLSTSVSTQAATLATTTGKLGAYWRTTAVAGNNRAQLAIWADANSGAGVDIIGDVGISGNLIVSGTITARKFDRTSMAREGSSVWTGSITPGVGQTVSVPWALSLTQIPPVGRFIYEYFFTLTSNAGTRQTTTHNGLTAYTDYIGDGGLSVVAVDAQGNQYIPRPNGSSAVLAATDFVPTWSATVRRGSTDTGFVDEGDYYRREISATYTLSRIDLKVTWVAI